LISNVINLREKIQNIGIRHSDLENEMDRLEKIALEIQRSLQKIRSEIE
jgi:hypothetical protein